MGYRIGYQCFINSESAHDYLLSRQPPTITADGQLIRPVKKGTDWYLNNQKIQLSFPECSIPEQIALGASLTAPLIMLAVMVWGFNAAKRMLWSMGNSDDD